MTRPGHFLACCCALFFALATQLSAETLTTRIEPSEVNVGDEVTVTYTVQNGGIGKIAFPPVDGLQVQPAPNMTASISFSNGTLLQSVSQSFRIVPTRSGDFTIPSFDITASDGQILRGRSLKLHVNDAGTAAPNNPQPDPQAASPQAAPAPASPDGVVIVSPTNPGIVPVPGNNTASAPDPYASVPRDADGGPAKVFMIVTPQTTEAYVGQSIPIQMDFYIRMESNADQNSLPTIKGSDFLMNSFSFRAEASMLIVDNVQYERDTWKSAISAPKSGDFPLSLERDTYWQKSSNYNDLDPFYNSGRRQNLAHEMITSNLLVVHVHPLPDVGRPAHFSGAIGQFKVTGDAIPTSVSAGEPVELNFSVSGIGNFDYVRCPVMPDDPAWKVYVATPKTHYFETDKSRTHAVKTFEQSAIAQRSGNVPLQAAAFSYFDPAMKQYVTVPIPLPAITVTGSPLASASAAPENPDEAPTIASATPNNLDLQPNRLEIGEAFADLTPAYRKAWFWPIQAGLLGVALLGALFVFLRPRAKEDAGRAERARLHSSQQQEEHAMAEAVQRQDPLAFFMAARHALQLQLGSQWHVPPEALTLGEIRRRDPQLAEKLGPLFAQADEVIYSGRMNSQIDLAHWDKTVREMLQPQTVST